MSKIGVGVGDEFPLDDGAAKSAAAETPRTPEDDRAEFEEWKRRRDAHRAQREAGAPAARNGAAAAMNGRNSARPAPPMARRLPRRARRRPLSPFPFFWAWVLADCWDRRGDRADRVRLSHIGYIIVGLAALALLFAAYHHHGHDPLDFGPRDYSRPSPHHHPRPPLPSRSRAGPKEVEMRHRHGHRFHGAAAEAMRAAADAMDTGERTTTRVQLEMPPQAMERLQRLKEKTEAAS